MSAKRVPMIATARQCYEGRWLHSGEPFEASSEEDAADLIAIDFAVRVNRPVPVTKEMDAGSPSGDAQEGVPTDVGTDTGAVATAPDEQDRNRHQKRNEYNHRSMRARK